MKKFIIPVIITVETYISVNANSIDDAMEKALDPKNKPQNHAGNVIEVESDPNRTYFEE
jgi:hypothetical protein